MSSKFNIGDEVWFACTQHGEAWVVCPDCFGKRFLTVILGDASQVTVDCTGCQVGYDPPMGKIKIYTYTPEIRKITIDGREEHKSEPTEYKYNSYSGGCCSAKEHQLFATEKEANLEAERLVKENKKNQQEQITRKEKPTRSWAWNATYHRNQIKEAERQLAYHKSKLAAAETHKGRPEWKPKVTTE